jgi:hypothetical protein
MILLYFRHFASAFLQSTKLFAILVRHFSRDCAKVYPMTLMSSLSTSRLAYAPALAFKLANFTADEMVVNI